MTHPPFCSCFACVATVPAPGRPVHLANCGCSFCTGVLASVEPKVCDQRDATQGSYQSVIDALQAEVGSLSAALEASRRRNRGLRDEVMVLKCALTSAQTLIASMQVPKEAAAAHVEGALVGLQRGLSSSLDSPSNVESMAAAFHAELHGVTWQQAKRAMNLCNWSMLRRLAEVAIEHIDYLRWRQPP